MQKKAAVRVVDLRYDVYPDARPGSMARPEP